MVWENFERGGGESDARASYGQAVELVVMVMCLLLSDCREKLQCILESYFDKRYNSLPTFHTTIYLMWQRIMK
jgi:hypothetical protein